MEAARLRAEPGPRGVRSSSAAASNCRWDRTVTPPSGSVFCRDVVISNCTFVSGRAMRLTRVDAGPGPRQHLTGRGTNPAGGNGGNGYIFWSAREYRVQRQLRRQPGPGRRLHPAPVHVQPGRIRSRRARVPGRQREPELRARREPIEHRRADDARGQPGNLSQPGGGDGDHPDLLGGELGARPAGHRWIPGAGLERHAGPAVVYIRGGPGRGQWRRIIANTSNTITIDRPWDVPPDLTSTLHAACAGGAACLSRNTLDGPDDDDGNGVPDYLEIVYRDRRGRALRQPPSTSVMDGNASPMRTRSLLGVAAILGIRSGAARAAHPGQLHRRRCAGSPGGRRSSPDGIGDGGVGPVTLNTMVRDNVVSDASMRSTWTASAPGITRTGTTSRTRCWNTTPSRIPRPSGWTSARNRATPSRAKPDQPGHRPPREQGAGLRRDRATSPTSTTTSTGRTGLAVLRLAARRAAGTALPAPGPGPGGRAGAGGAGARRGHRGPELVGQRVQPLAVAEPHRRRLARRGGLDPGTERRPHGAGGGQLHRGGDGDRGAARPSG